MLRLYTFLLVVCLLASCQNQQTDTFHAFDSSEWIGSTQDQPDNDSLLYQDSPAPVFVKEFSLSRAADEASLLISAAGYYTVWINGQKVGDDYISPAWTDYSKRIYYRQYQVQPLLRRGKNVIRVELGNGWYNPLPLRMWGHANLRERLTVGQPRFILDLRAEKKGKPVSRIVSDASWMWAPGEIRRNNIYLGEWQDLRQKPQKFDLPVRLLPSPGGQLQLADFPPIRRTEQLRPVDLWVTEDQTLMIDFGQNMAGSYRYEGPSIPGDTIYFRSGERIWPDSTLNALTAVCGQIKRPGVGGPGAPDVAEQIDVFIPAREGDAFEPRYTFHGFRYLEMSGLGLESLKTISPDNFIAWRMGTDVEKISSFTADQKWINQLQHTVEWTMLSNIFSVISDCPAREKFGYGGDLNATTETWLYNYDAKEFLIKTIRDWADAMNDKGFVDTAPFVGIQYCGISWESAFLLIQDYLFRFYGDEVLVRNWYDKNVEWMSKANRLLGKDLVRSGLSDHESLEPVPVELVGSLHYYHSMRVMQKFSQILGKTSQAREYGQMADEYQGMLVDSLWKQPVKPITNIQTWISGLLYYQILPDPEKQVALNRLVNDLKKRDLALTTGIFGTPWMLEALSANGQVQLAFDLVSRSKYPGWRYMLNNGATTIWETWKESDNVFSQNHPMFGSVSTFFHKWIGGIDPIDQGFSRVILHPSLVRGLDQFEIDRKTPTGILGMSWDRQKDKMIIHIQVPEKSEVIWAPQLIQPFRLDHILGPDGQVTQSDQAAIVFNDPGKFVLTYRNSVNN